MASHFLVSLKAISSAIKGIRKGQYRRENTRALFVSHDGPFLDIIIFSVNGIYRLLTSSNAVMI